MDIGFLKSWEKGDKKNKLRKKTLKFFEYSHSYIHFLTLRLDLRLLIELSKG